MRLLFPLNVHFDGRILARFCKWHWGKAKGLQTEDAIKHVSESYRKWLMTDTCPCSPLCPPCTHRSGSPSSSHQPEQPRLGKIASITDETSSCDWEVVESHDSARPKGLLQAGRCHHGNRMVVGRGWRGRCGFRRGYRGRWYIFSSNIG